MHLKAELLQNANGVIAGEFKLKLWADTVVKIFIFFQYYYLKHSFSIGFFLKTSISDHNYLFLMVRF